MREATFAPTLMQHSSHPGPFERMRRKLPLPLPILLGLAAGCRPAPPPVAPPPPPPAPPPVAVVDTVWTAVPEVVVRAESTSVVLPRLFTRLEVLEADSLGLLVRCGVCADTTAGRVDSAAVLREPALPRTAAAGTLTEFALAVRGAAARRDLVALRPVMALDFSFSLVGTGGRDVALSSWVSENFRTLDRVPGLLDRGLTPMGDFWVAPAEYQDRLDYRGLRLGFQCSPAGRWEWVFLTRGDLDTSTADAALVGASRRDSIALPPPAAVREGVPTCAGGQGE